MPEGKEPYKMQRSDLKPIIGLDSYAERNDKFTSKTFCRECVLSLYNSALITLPIAASLYALNQ